jgi:tetratricopeptide (TPR) repeat protein
MPDAVPHAREVIRCADSFTIQSVVTSTQSSLAAILSRQPFASMRCIFSDLTLSGWRSNQTAREFLEQIGDEQISFSRSEPLDHPSVSDRDDRGRDADGIGQLIDDESRGNACTIVSLRLAQRIVARISVAQTPHLLVVLMPRFGMSWRTDNTTLLDFLASGLQGTQSRILLAAGGDDFTPPPARFSLEWLAAPEARVAAGCGKLHPAALLPGVIDLDLFSAMSGDADAPPGLISSQRRVVPPEWRRKPSPRSRPDYDRLATWPEISDSYRAFAQLHGSVYYRDAGLLCREAWRQFRDGSYEIAKDYLEGAILCTSEKEQRARLLLDLQGMRIATQSFYEAAAVADPAEHLPTPIRGPLFQTKGWALTMLGSAVEGRRYLAHACSLLAADLEGSRRFLYLENIYALSLLKSGEAQEALRVEQEIERTLERRAREEGRRDWQLTYVNMMNQARLYRILDDKQRALDYYRRAFDTTLGLRSESDSIYANVCLGRLFADRGEIPEAFVCWMRGGLHWASASIPEALAPRVVRSILHRDPRPGESIPEAVSAAIRGEIIKAASAAGWRGETGGKRFLTPFPPYFRRGGIEAVYDVVPENVGLMAFAPVVPARGPMFGAAARAEKEFGGRPVLSEEEFYGEP